MIGIVDLFGAAFGTSGRSSNQNNQNLVPSNGGNQRKIAD
jgi:hypothetical protein